MTFPAISVATAVENVYDVIEFIVHHFPHGFNSLEERQHLINKIREANPLTAEREKAEKERIDAERAKDLGGARDFAAAPQFSQADIDAAVARALANTNVTRADALGNDPNG